MFGAGGGGRKREEGEGRGVPLTTLTDLQDEDRSSSDWFLRSIKNWA